MVIGQFVIINSLNSMIFMFSIANGQFENMAKMSELLLTKLSNSISVHILFWDILIYWNIVDSKIKKRCPLQIVKSDKILVGTQGLITIHLLNLYLLNYI